MSIYDEKDQDHREKRRRYHKEKASRDGSVKDTLKDIERFYKEEEKDPGCSGTEISLAIFCIISFALYVAAELHSETQASLMQMTNCNKTHNYIYI